MQTTTLPATIGPARDDDPRPLPALAAYAFITVACGGLWWGILRLAWPV